MLIKRHLTEYEIQNLKIERKKFNSVCDLLRKECRKGYRQKELLKNNIVKNTVYQNINGLDIKIVGETDRNGRPMYEQICANIFLNGRQYFMNITKNGIMYVIHYLNELDKGLRVVCNQKDINNAQSLILVNAKLLLDAKNQLDQSNPENLKEY